MPTAVASPRDRMISPMMMAWFRSPPGDDSNTVSPATRWASSSLSRNQLAVATPIVPLMANAGRARAEPSKSAFAISKDVMLGEK
jgi:hypothetical protein